MARDSLLRHETFDDLPTTPGSIVAGRYRVDRVLGSGPMSVVVAATHLEIERAVAIKFLNPDGAGHEDAAERFRREAQTAARIKNEHVVRVIDVGTLIGGLPFMVMDLVDGRSLKDELVARGPLPVAEAAGYVLQAIEALAEAHSAGVVHRDIKPANLFLAERPDRTRVVKVLDFGVSKWLGEPSNERLGLTRTGMVVGSPLYMPPEQLQSPKTVDWRADVWALGVVLYELVTGHVPYDTCSLPELCTMLLTEPPAPIDEHRKDVPRAFEAVILRCLARDPSDRYQSVAELGSALTPFAAPDLAVHAERARRTLGRTTNPASSGVKVAFVADGVRTPSRASIARRPLFPRIMTWAGWSLALGALLGLGIASLEPPPSPKRDAGSATARATAAETIPAEAPAPTTSAAPIEVTPVSAEPVASTKPTIPPAPRPARALSPPPKPTIASPAPGGVATTAPGNQLTDFGGRK